MISSKKNIGNGTTKHRSLQSCNLLSGLNILEGFIKRGLKLGAHFLKIALHSSNSWVSNLIELLSKLNSLLFTLRGLAALLQINSEAAHLTKLWKNLLRNLWSNRDGIISTIWLECRGGFRKANFNVLLQRIFGSWLQGLSQHALESMCRDAAVDVHILESAHNISIRARKRILLIRRSIEVWQTFISAVFAQRTTSSLFNGLALRGLNIFGNSIEQTGSRRAGCLLGVANNSVNALSNLNFLWHI
eukprot:Blabericola_migrator_1__3@NODE_1001_length_5735_cov_490_698659_g689_i0_p6_GENE_NODE_1001_length_5735_cov_490_698659_g689_i0NODE_1001_length_5735_cov_490_698659_g689_i0_p6_ORF_typecomplete_len246_score36_36_NODE_1001_length_5735_cov_490_698659_g689_i043205057